VRYSAGRLPALSHPQRRAGRFSLAESLRTSVVTRSRRRPARGDRHFRLAVGLDEVWLRTCQHSTTAIGSAAAPGSRIVGPEVKNDSIGGSAQPGNEPPTPLLGIGELVQRLS
jgi:hypothetical protein